MKSFILAVLAVVTLSGCGSSISGEPMPMTEQAANRLNQAAGTLNAERELMSVVGGDAEQILEKMIDVYTRMYESIGYSLEATLVEVDKGANQGTEEERKAYAEASYMALPMAFTVANLMSKVAEQGELDLDDYLHEDAAEAAHRIAKNSRR